MGKMIYVQPTDRHLEKIRKNKFESVLYLITFIKTNPSWVKYLHVKNETARELEEIIENSLFKKICGWESNFYICYNTQKP